MLFMPYYALLDNEEIKPLGDCADFEEADGKAPGNVLWIFNQESLKKLSDAISKASPHIQESKWETFVRELVEKHGGEDGVWGQHPGFPRKDWQYEVGNGDTNLGYWDWVGHQLEAAEGDN